MHVLTIRKANELLHNQKSTKKEARQAARELKPKTGDTIAKLTEELLAEIKRQETVVERKRAHRMDLMKRNQHAKSVVSASSPCFRHSCDMMISVEERLRRIREVRTRETVDGFRKANAGNHSLSINYVESCHDVCAEGRSIAGDVYSRRCKYRKTDSTLTLRLPQNWYRCIFRRDLAWIDGLLTLWMSEVPERHTEGKYGQVVVYPAKWARQSRGFSVETELGWIACCNGYYFHSTKSPKEAARGVSTKFGNQALPSEELDRRARQGRRAKQKQLVHLYRRLKKGEFDELKQVEVSIDDSLRAGNCEPGTYEFRERLGLVGHCATLGEIMERIEQSDGVDLRDRRQVTIARQFAAAVLRASRRQKVQVTTPAKKTNRTSASSVSHSGAKQMGKRDRNNLGAENESKRRCRNLAKGQSS